MLEEMAVFSVVSAISSNKLRLIDPEILTLVKVLFLHNLFFDPFVLKSLLNLIFHRLNFYKMNTYFKPPKWLFLLTLSLFAAQLFGQNTNKTKPVYRFGVKAYLNVSHENKYDRYTDDLLYRTTVTTQKSTDVFPTFGFSKNKKKGRFYEISFTHFSFKHDDALTQHWLDTVNMTQIPSRGAKSNTAYVGMRYEWNFPVFYEKMGRFQPYIGVSTDPSVFFENIEPYTTATFPSIVFEARNTISVIPRAVANLSSRLFLDLNMPISVFSVAATYSYYGNPILPTYARSGTDFTTKFFTPQFNIRLGLGYRI